MRIRTDRTIRAVEFSTSWFASTSNRKVSFQEGVAKQLATPFLQGSLSTDYTDSTKYRCNLWIENRKIQSRGACVMVSQTGTWTRRLFFVGAILVYAAALTMGQIAGGLTETTNTRLGG